MSIEVNQSSNETVKRAELFVARHLEPVASELDHAAEHPSSVMQLLAEGGYLGLLVPVEYGGTGINFLDYLKIMEVFSAACPAVVSILNAHALTAYAIARWGTDTQKKSCLPDLAKGKTLGGCALTDGGPMPAMMAGSLMASACDEGYVLNGQKSFVRNAGSAQLFITFANSQADDDVAVTKTLIIDARSTGVSVGPKIPTMGLTACQVAHIHFKQAAVSNASVLGQKGEDSGIAAHLLAVAAVMAAAQTVGIGMAAVKHSAQHARQRIQFHRPVAAFQAVQTLLAEAQSTCYLACQSVYQIGRLIDAGEPFENEAAMLKSFLARSGSRVLIDCCQVEGGLGISESMPKGIQGTLPLARMFRDIVGTTLLDSPDDFPEELIAANV